VPCDSGGVSCDSSGVPCDSGGVPCDSRGATGDSRGVSCDSGDTLGLAYVVVKEPGELFDQPDQPADPEGGEPSLASLAREPGRVL
jgi:hypothetical protein